MRVTVKDVRQQFVCLVKRAAELGFDTTKWILQEGNGANAYRLFDTAGGGHWNTPFGGDRGFLGKTAREAEATLRAYRRALNAVASLQRPRPLPDIDTGRPYD